MKIIANFQSIEAFSTERLIAEKIKSSDLGKFIIMNANENVMATLGGLCNIEQSKQDNERHLMRWDKQGFGSWILYLKETHEWLGRGGLRRLEIAGNEEVEVGYALIPSFWNKGFATEIAKAYVEIAFEVIFLNHIVCFTETTNLVSRKVMEKAGFQ